MHDQGTDRDSDRARDNRLMAAGWRVLRYSWWDLKEQPAVVGAQLLDACAVRRAA